MMENYAPHWLVHQHRYFKKPVKDFKYILPTKKRMEMRVT